MLTELIIIVFGSSLLSAVIIYLISKFAPKLNLIAIPNNRSSHLKPIPQGGGIGISLAIFISGIYLVNDNIISNLNWYILCYLMLVITLIGLLDDIFSLSAKNRLLIQIIVLGALIFINYPVPTLLLPGNIILDGWLIVILLIIAGTWWINLFNFMDGVDGIAASQAIFMLASGVGISILGGASIYDKQILWMLATIGATLVFLLFNWQPAKIFLGDSGSLLLGLFIFSSALLSISSGWINYPVWSILAAYFVSDATVTLITRIFKGDNIMQPHLNHLFHRLAIRWTSHKKVTILIILINVLWILPIAVITKYLPDSIYQLLLVLLAYFPIVILCLIFQFKNIKEAD